MKPSILEHIVCPTCRSDFKLLTKSKLKNEIKEGTLICVKCKDKFKITKGIPRFVVDLTKDFVRTEMAFSAKWKNHHRNHHAKDWVNWQKNWFLERFDWKSIGQFNTFLKSVDFAYKKYGTSSNIHFIQADIRQLPFRKTFFDYIFSDQVLHHTKNTSTSFKYLTKFLAKSGFISIYVYNKKAPIREYVDDYIRKRTVKMSVRECTEFSKDMAYLGRTLSKLRKKITIPRDIPLLGVKAGTYDIQRFVYWNFLKCFWDESDNFQRSVGVNFDWYYPKFAYRHTVSEVKKWFRDAKLKITTLKEIESGISVTGRKKS